MWHVWIETRHCGEGLKDIQKFFMRLPNVFGNARKISYKPLDKNRNKHNDFYIINGSNDFVANGEPIEISTQLFSPSQLYSNSYINYI